MEVWEEVGRTAMEAVEDSMIVDGKVGWAEFRALEVEGPSVEAMASFLASEAAAAAAAEGRQERLFPARTRCTLPRKVAMVILVVEAGEDAAGGEGGMIKCHNQSVYFLCYLCCVYLVLLI